jgi:hypothetical protein
MSRGSNKYPTTKMLLLLLLLLMMMMLVIMAPITRTLLLPTATESPPQNATAVRGAEPILAVNEGCVALAK